MVFEKLLGRCFKPLILDTSWNVVLFEDASRNEDIVVDSWLIVDSPVRRQQEPVEVIFVLASLLVLRQIDFPINVHHCGLADGSRLGCLDHVIDSLNGLVFAVVPVSEIVHILHLLNMRDEVLLGHRLVKELRRRWMVVLIR